MISPARLRDTGGVLLDVGMPGRARAVFDRLLEIAPDDCRAQLGVAECLLQQQRPGDAVEVLQRLGGDDPIVWRLLSLAALAAGDGAAARSAFECHAQLTGEGPDPLSLAAASFYEADLDNCRRHVQAAISAQPDRAEARDWQAKLASLDGPHVFLVDVARSHLRRGDRDRAMPILDAAADSGDSAEYRLLKGSTLIVSGRFDEAIEHLRAAAACYPEQPELRSELGAVLLLVGRVDEAALELDRALAVAAAPHSAMVRRAQAAAANSDIPTAVNWARAACGDDPADPEAWLVSAQVAELDGRGDDVRILADHAVALNPADPNLWAEAARLLRAGDPDMADHYSRRALLLSGSVETIDDSRPTPPEPELAQLADCTVGGVDVVHALEDRMMIAEHLGHIERAVAFQEAIWRRSPEVADDADFHARRGSLLAAAGAVHGAQASYRRALMIDSEHGSARSSLAALEALLST